MMSRNPLNAFFIISTAVCLVVVISLFILAATDLGRDNIFPNGILRRESYEHPSKVRPDRWKQQTVWIIVLTLQLAWVLYVQSLLCPRGYYPHSRHKSPSFIPQSFYGIYILSLAILVLWLFTKDNDFSTASSISISATTFSLIVCYFISIHQLWLYEGQLRNSDMWLTIVLVQNGIGLFATWCWILTILDLENVLIQEADMKVEDAATICLSVVLTECLVSVSADMYLSKKWSRYLISPYILMTLLVAGMMYDNWEDGDRLSYIFAGLLCTMVAGCLAKLGAIVYWTRTFPLSIEATLY